MSDTACASQTLTEVAREADLLLETPYKRFKTKEEREIAFAGIVDKECRRRFEDNLQSQSTFKIWLNWLLKKQFRIWLNLD